MRQVASAEGQPVERAGYTGYPDNVKRKWGWEAAHPDATIRTDRDPEGRFVFTAEIPGREPVQTNDLGELLDQLDKDS